MEGRVTIFPDSQSPYQRSPSITCPSDHALLSNGSSLIY